MKIIISNYDDLKNPYYGGGGAYAIHELAKRLIRKFDVTVITGKYPGCRDQIVDKVKYKRIGIENAGPRLGQIIYYFSLIYYFKILQFDLWIENFTPPFSTNFLQVLTRKPVIGLVHMLAGEDMRRKYKIPFDQVEKLGAKTYKYFIVPTDSVKKKIMKINPKAKVEVIPNGVDKLSIKRSGGDHILFIGRIEVNQKGLDLLLSAFSKIESRIPYDLLIAGTGAPADLIRLRKIVKFLKLEGRVKLVGRVNAGRKERLFAKSLFAVIPSRFETFSLTALESLARGVPIVTFDIEGLSWIPEGLSVKVDPFDSNLLSKAMLKLSKNEKLRKSLRSRGISYARTLNWNRVVKDYINFFESIVGMKGEKYGFN